MTGIQENGMKHCYRADIIHYDSWQKFIFTTVIMLLMIRFSSMPVHTFTRQHLALLYAGINNTGPSYFYCPYFSGLLIYCTYNVFS